MVEVPVHLPPGVAPPPVAAGRCGASMAPAEPTEGGGGPIQTVEVPVPMTQEEVGWVGGDGGRWGTPSVERWWVLILCWGRNGFQNLLLFFVSCEVVHVPKVITQTRVRQRAGVVWIGGWLGGKADTCVVLGRWWEALRGPGVKWPERHEQVEQTVEVPVPMTQEEVVHVPKAARLASHVLTFTVLSQSDLFDFWMFLAFVCYPSRRLLILITWFERREVTETTQRLVNVNAMYIVHVVHLKPFSCKFFVVRLPSFCAKMSWVMWGW